MADVPAPLDPVLLEVVRCPKSHHSLTVAGSELVCEPCALAFPVRDGIPVLLLDEAREVGS